MKGASFWSGALLVLLGCQNSSQPMAGGADDHGNAIALRIQVEDSTGAAQAGVRVTVRPESWIPEEGASASGVAVSGLDGFCSFGSLPPGNYRVVADGGATMATVVVAIEESASIRMSTYATGSIRGRLDGAARGTSVAIQGTDIVSEVDDSGAFRFHRLPVGIFRIMAGSRGRLALERIPVLPRILSRLDEVAFDSGRTAAIEPTLRLEADLAPPVVDSLPGNYSGPLRLVFRPSPPSDLVEISLDGGDWIPIADAILLGTSRCLQARSRRGSETSASTGDLCYTLH